MKNMDAKRFTDKFKGKVKEAIFAEGVVHDEKAPCFELEKSVLVDACRFLRDEMGFDQLSFLTAVDYLGKPAEGDAPAAEPRIEIVYRLSRTDDGGGLTLKLDIKREKEDVPTVGDIWRTAEWHERELYDMFGVTVSGHRELKRILLPEGWDDHPLRKDVDSNAKANRFQKLNK